MFIVEGMNSMEVVCIHTVLKNYLINIKICSDGKVTEDFCVCQNLIIWIKKVLLF